ncbi:MAG: hypothetical protein H0T68_02555 [Gemmatimonadales bacterium]|nr:hypothetical protein [Gemmatimonadales bacterium]MBA3555560.1 hypothetical protein [Gemmatimonadales bacterium]
MAQRFFVDRSVQAAYLVLLLAGCRSAPGSLVPAAAQPVTEAQVAGWVATTVPEQQRLHRFKWLFRDENSSAGGRGSARIAPPDSLRFDVAGPFGSGAASAAVVGEQPLWTEPPDAIAKLVPNFPLMWAMFGIARLPENGAELRGLSEGRVTAWQYLGPADTLEYVRTDGSPARLVAEVRRAGQVIGRAETTLDSTGAPLTARLTVPSAPARLDLTFSSTTPADFAPDIWVSRKP